VETRKERGLKQLPDGRWQFSWCYEGRYHRRAAATKGEARAYLQKIHTQIREGKYLEVKKEAKTTFEEGVKRFLEWSQTNKRPRTAEHDEWISTYWLASPHLAGKRLERITAGDVAAFVQALRRMPRRPHRGGIRHLASGRWQASWVEAGRQHRFRAKSEAEARGILKRAMDRRAKNGCPAEECLTKRTIDIILSRLKRMFSLCMTWGLCTNNPAAKIPLFRDDARRVRYLSEEEERHLLAHCSPGLSRIVRFALHTGARKGEILGSRWKHVDLRNAVLTVPCSQAKGRRDRYIHLNAVALAILNELPRPMDRNAFVFGTGSSPLPATFERHWRQAMSSANLSDFHFHDLRHTFASRLVMAGVDLAILRELLGYADFTMTLRYAHLHPSRLKAAVAILERENLQFTCNPSEEGPGASQGGSLKVTGM
jgi:integrase